MEQESIGIAHSAFRFIHHYYSFDGGRLLLPPPPIQQIITNERVKAVDNRIVSNMQRLHHARTQLFSEAQR